MDRPHWSYSQLSQFMRCPLQYFFERVAKLPKPFTPSSLVLGAAVHQALAEYHRLLQLDRATPPKHIEETFLTGWMRFEADKPIQYRDGDSRNKLMEQGLALLAGLPASAPSPANRGGGTSSHRAAAKQPG